jgi:iron complex outermembrane receptor protein
MNIDRRGTITSAVLAILSVAGSAAAQEPTRPTGSDEGKLEEVVVTGTSIRGAAPVGSNLITVGREEIEASGAQTIQQVLRSVPSVTGFGNSAQGVAGQGGGGAAGFQSFDGAGSYTPTLHGLGASASNGTLILVDGHRLPLSGINHTLADPSVIAPLAIERVEILPDGASAVYGSDAVAGVLNFITRRNFQGFEANVQAAFADGYDTMSGGFIAGTRGDAGSVMATYNYSKRDPLLAGERDFTAANHTAQGGGNFANFNCEPAAVVPAAGQPGAGLVFAAPYTGTGIANNAANGFCDFSGRQDLVAADDRHNFLVKLEKQMNDNLLLTTDLVYATQRNVSRINRGSINANAFATGATTVPGTAVPVAAGQINPFFAGPAGVNTGQVRFQADELFGPGAKLIGGAESLFGTFAAEYSFGDNWRGTFGTTIGSDDSRQRRDGALCVSCALLALNGTTNTAGNNTTPSVPGTPTAVLAGPLTAATALDVWNPAATNRTSDAVRAQLLDSTQLQIAHQTLKDFTLKFDGSLFEMPGGPLRAAIGAEYIEYTMREELTRERGTGPASSNSFSTFLNFDRDVTSGFVEILVPVFGEKNGFAGMRELQVNLSGRYDEYSDFGSTFNPKFAFNWTVVNGLRLRANYAESFTAPALTSRGTLDRGITAESSFGGLTGATASGVNANFAIPNTYPGAVGLPGCTTATPTCIINSSTVPGIFLAGGNKDVTAQEGETYSAGFDVTPTALPGLRFSATWWNVKYLGAITAPQAAFAISSPDLASLLQLFPGGVPAATIAAVTSGLPQASPLAPTSYFIYSFQQRNAFNLTAEGIDAEIAYRFETGVGSFNLGLAASHKLKMEQQFGTGGETFSVLNTIGINTTFPSNETAARASLGWRRNALSVDAFVNYAGSYLNWNGSAPFPVIRNAAFSPVGGGQNVDSYSTVDLHVGYNFANEGALSGTSLFLDATNVTDEEPPFVNAPLGFDGFNANPIGRVVTVGVGKKW